MVVTLVRSVRRSDLFVLPDCRDEVRPPAPRSPEPEDPSHVTTPDQTAGDGGGSQPLLPGDPVDPTQAPAAPVQYLTRREAREAERRAAAAAQTAAGVGAPEASVAAAPSVAPTESTAPTADVTTPAVGTAAATAEPVVTTTSTATTDPAGATRASGTRGRRAAQGGRRSTHQPAPGRREQAAVRAERTSTARAAASARTAAARAARPTSPRTSSGSFGRTTKKVTVLGSMLFAGGMLVATSVPALAFQVETPGDATAARTTLGTQSFVADAAAVEGDVTRDGYSVTTPAAKIAKTDSSAFTNDVNGTVQWPFPTGVPISSGFGARQVAGCSFCSTFHQGLDFTPGSGTPIQSVADGVVTKVDGPSGALGNNVWIEHTIDGQKVTSVYAHMQTGSVEVTKGQRVSVGDIVGKVGSTGNSTGAHLHFEIIVGGVPIDPYPWLTANAN